MFFPDYDFIDQEYDEGEEDITAPFSTPKMVHMTLITHIVAPSPNCLLAFDSTIRILLIFQFQCCSQASPYR
jgi:hypothetical protein